MKPPVRRRSAPRRYLVPESSHQQLVWTTREKRELLRGLKEQVSEKAPRATVDGRSDGEVAYYFSWLRSRAARETIQTEYGKMVHQKKLQMIREPAPIEIWTDLASRICSTTEQAMSAAFSQMLTIASTEPVTLHHSIPCKEPPAVSGHTVTPNGQNLQHKESSEVEPSSSEVEPSSSGKEPTNSHHDGWNNLDFENIYLYLSKAVIGEVLPKLSEFESAVVLRLLRCIPDEFRHLDAPRIGCYLYDTYNFLTTRLKSEDTEEEETLSEAQEPNWRELGFCPLNPLMMPLELLKQKKDPAAPR
ncbi:snRNA-activating protein complex subunit 2 [Dendrobates tinctorius]|uniref:snRNA-activating protein complex subunit 2 n=1 Tax=Dendrobates tinctorius TaxID=92724 RepID=UPI003CC9C226